MPGLILGCNPDTVFSTHAKGFCGRWRIAVEVQYLSYIVQILEGGLDDEVVPDILRGSQRAKFLEPLRRA